MRGAGGTQGGLGEFLLGLAMFCGGGYLFLDSIQVHSGHGVGGAMYQVGGVGVTTGMILLPFALGVGMIFYNARSPIGWLVAGGSLVALGAGVIARAQLHFQHMTAFSLLTILVLMVGGLAIVLRSLRDHGAGDDDASRPAR